MGWQKQGCMDHDPSAVAKPLQQTHRCHRAQQLPLSLSLFADDSGNEDTR